MTSPGIRRWIRADPGRRFSHDWEAKVEVGAALRAADPGIMGRRSFLDWIRGLVVNGVFSGGIWPRPKTEETASRHFRKWNR